METESIPKLKIRVHARDIRTIRGLVRGYAEAAQETLPALEQQLASEGKAYLMRRCEI